MKPKVVIISGLTGVGKSRFACQLAEKLSSKIIVGDSLQIYKNFPISSNFPSEKDKKRYSYELLGEVDVLENRLISIDYRKLVLERIKSVVARGKIPIIEGGSGFYLNYLLTSSSNEFDTEVWERATQEARQMMRGFKDLNECVAEIARLCPKYDNSIDPNDHYRLEKGLRYAIASQGVTFTHRQNLTHQVKERYDIRGFVLVTDPISMKQTIEARCDKMIENGLIDEYLELLEKVRQQPAEYRDLPVPIGYTQISKLINSLQSTKIQPNVHPVKYLAYVQDEIRGFIADFQQKSRQYSAYQRKFFRQKFKDFAWLEIPADPNLDSENEVLVKLEHLTQCDREVYDKELRSEENIRILNELPSKKLTRIFKPQAYEYNYGFLLNYFIQKYHYKLMNLGRVTEFV